MKIHNRIISFILILSVIFSVLLIAPFSAVASTIKLGSTVQLTATCNYDDAFEVLNKVNEHRTAQGLSPMTMDPQMMEDAMQRAAELMMIYAHARPDGTSYSLINKDVYAENIATGYINPEAAMNGWVNSDFHYANIMSEDFNCIGIGAIVHNGVHCWVQLFGFDAYEGEVVVPENTAKEFDIYVGNFEYELYIDIPQTIFAGDSANIQVNGQTKDNECYYTLNNDDFTFSSSDNSIVSIDGDKIVAGDVGSATITATSDYTTVSAQIEVVEFSAGKSHQCGENIFWDYKNGTLTLSGTGEMYEYHTAYNNSNEVVSDVPYFDSFENVKKVVVGEGITGISQYAFSCFKKLETVELPYTLNVIGRNAFAECSKLKEITIHEGIKEIPFACFESCLSLESINIPQSVETIGNNAFLYCVSLQYVDIPDKLSYLASGSFFGCSSLREFTVPSTIDIIESGTFNQCRSLKKLTVLNPDIKFGVTDMFKSIADSLTIYGYEDSTAESHCKANSITFVSLGDAPAKKKLGDVNLDGEVTILDATEIQRHLAQLAIISDEGLSCADADKNGIISVMDATYIQRFVAQLIPEL